MSPNVGAEPVLVPLLNANEPEAIIVDLAVANGDVVAVDQPICTVETTKSTEEVLATRPGFVAGLRVGPGDPVVAGDVICWVADTAGWEAPSPAPTPNGDREAEPPPGLRITEPALALARAEGLALDRLPIGPLVTNATVRALIVAAPEPSWPSSGTPDAGSVLVYGGGGHGKTLIELLRAGGGFRVAGIVDQGLSPGTEVLGVPVLGGDDALPRLRSDGHALAVNGIGGIASIGARVEAFRRLTDAGFDVPTIVHPTAVVEPSAWLGAGSQILARAYVGSDARVGRGAIVNTAAVVSHDCELGDVANISPGALLAGGVRVGAHALVGMGVTAHLGITIGAGSRVGNGAVLTADVPPDSRIRSGTVWPVRP